LGGTKHFELKNNIRGKIQENSDEKALPDSFFKRPIVHKEDGTHRLAKTNHAPTGILPAQDRYEQGHFCKKR
ncbi:MAG: hypothetical protein RLZZ628_4381, partial [Bacteroidota bacterium]